MKVLFDHQIYNNQNYGGISRYFYELSKGLKKQNVDVENTIAFSDNGFTQDKDIFNARKLPAIKFKGKSFLKKHFNQYTSEKIIKKGNFDIFHPTYYGTYFVDRQKLKKPFVVTFYDLIHEKFAEKYPEDLTNVEQELTERRLLLQKASKIISISHSTKQDIIDYYQVDPAKIEVTHLASSMSIEGVRENEKLGKYVLYVGNRSAYKNFKTFVRAIAPLLVNDPELKIVSAGGGAFVSEEQAFFQSLHISNQVIQIGINDKILADLYFNAQCFIFPSLYEGFGIPALEAFSCNCPTILSNVSSLPEVGGDAALYVNPENENDILTQVEKFVNNPNLRNEYKIKGLKQAEKFSWDTMASKTLEIYQSIL